MIVRSLSRVIWSVIKAEVLPFPTREQRKRIAAGFEKKRKFPALSWRYRLLQWSIAIVDSDYRFVYVDIGSYGKNYDSLVFQRTRLWRSTEGSNLYLPNEKFLPDARSLQLHYVFITDEAFVV